MIEFKIQLDESLVQTFGYANIQQHLQSSADKIMLKMAAKEVLEDLKTIDLENDKQWQTARELAWQQEKSKYITAK